MTKILDMVPDFVNKFTGGQKEVSKEAVETAETIAENAKEVTKK